MLIPAPPVKSTLKPSVISTAVPVSPSKLQDVYDPAGVAQTLSPLKKVVPPGVPVAERSEVVVTAPVALFCVISIKVPLLGVKLSTPEPEPSISTHAVLLRLYLLQLLKQTFHLHL